jgi:NAD(P)-dependent dehydrogenase (short-subunit alcohol dehydrogenase family)
VARQRSGATIARKPAERHDVAEDRSIVNVASIASYGNTGRNHVLRRYQGSLIRLTKRFAFELGPYNINVNAVAQAGSDDILTQGKDPGRNRAPGKGFRESGVLGRIGNRPISPPSLLSSPGCQFCHRTILTADRGRMDYLSFPPRTLRRLAASGFAHGHPAAGRH